MPDIDLFTPIASRSKSRFGIRPALDYVGGFSGCLSGNGACPSSLLGVSGKQWEDCVKKAAADATYSNSKMLVKEFGDAGDGDPDGAVLAFENILTASARDRDGDILESSGAILDMKMPLLWQHLSIQPIGRLVREVSRSRSMIKTRFAIADTELGRDAATLVKFGALRISHGFEPIDYEPIYDEKDRQSGWRIKKFTIYEGSVVSIPANPTAEILEVFEKTKSWGQELDGIRTAYGRDLLKSASVKAWAGEVYKARPVQVKGVEMPKAADGDSVCSCKSTKPAAKGVAGVLTKDTAPSSLKMYGEYHFTGSFEQIQSQLSKSLHRYMMKVDEDCSEYSWCYILATFDGFALVCSEGRGRSGYETNCYKLDYSVSGDEVSWSGVPEPVDVKVTAEVLGAAKSLQMAGDESHLKSISKRLSGIDLKARDKACKCPKCGHSGNMTSFMEVDGKSDDMDADDASDGKKSLTVSQVESQLMSHLLNDIGRMRKFRDGLNAVLSVHEVDAQEWSADEVLSQLAGLN